MYFLKCIVYIFIALVALTVLATGGLFIVFLAAVAGSLFTLVGILMFTASNIKAYFENTDKPKDP
jgi:hypothetical protein